LSYCKSIEGILSYHDDYVVGINSKKFD